MEDLLGTLDDPALPLLQWGDKFSAAATRLPPKLATELEVLPSMSLMENFHYDVKPDSLQ